MRINALIFPAMTQLDFTGPYEVFGSLPDTEVRVVAPTLEPVVAGHGLRFLPDVALADAPPCDLLFVPGGAGVSAMMQDRVVLEWLRDQAGGARYVTSVCTGALVLGAAGLLKGYRATTHWLSLDLLAEFGAIPEKDRVVTDRNRITGGGVTAGIDFALTVAADVYGSETARGIQLMLEYDPAPPFRGGHPDRAEPALVTAMRRKRAGLQSRRLEEVRRVAAWYCG